MNGRQKKLLEILLRGHNEAVQQVQTLAELLDCSEKTVRNDLKQVEVFLQEVSKAVIVRKPGVGVYLEAEQIERAQLSKMIWQKASQTQGERLVEIGYQLLTSDKPITLQKLSERYYVPKATIKKDIEEITKWLNRFDIELVSRQKLGSTIQGTELKRRSALAHLTKLNVTLENKGYVLDLFPPYEVTIVKNLLQNLESRFSIPFADGALESLLVHALIMIKRTRQRSSVSVVEVDKRKIKQKQDYQYIKWFTEQLERNLKITFPEDERVYFTLHLISSKRKREAGPDDLLVEQDLLVKVVSDLVKKADRLTMAGFEADPLLQRGLMIHLHSVLNRITSGFAITNPLLVDIKKMYPYIFNMIILALQEIKETYHLIIPEDEAAYLVLHFQASIERKDGIRENKKRLLIVCHLGVGMSRLLEVKMEQYYQDIHVIGCVGKADLNEFLNKQSVDMVISTVDLPNLHIPYIVISPLLESRDREKLNQFFEKYENEKKDGGEGSSLLSLVNHEIVHLHIKKEHPFEVVEMLGNSLYKQGYVHKNFTHSALIRERTSATSIGGGVAIPHGQPDLIIKSAISVATLEEPLRWGDELVSVVFLLAISNDDSKLTRGAIGEIVAINESGAMVQELIKVNDAKAFLDILKRRTL
ncbi:BglG family transcription antiterminator [Alkalihalobacillus sp. 1P02AB]|uniref:BglG family transcription antiterminator n=1 Tax=Alkalihalobacillus sp. 1P02AB TaxID=3132260 RepID=UPI0039A44CF8